MVQPNVIELASYKNHAMTSPLTTPGSWVTPLREYVRWLRGGDYPQTTEKLRCYHLKRFATTTGLDPYEVTLDHLLDWLGRHDWSSSTRRSHRTTLRSFYGWAHAAGRIATNPAALLPKISEPAGLPRPAPDSIIRDSLTHAGERVKLMILLAATASLRSCEIAVVNMADITGWREAHSLVVHGKGRKTRVVPISDSLAVSLRGRALRNPGGWVFEGQIDGHLSAKRVSELISEALPGGWTAHTLRHRFASVAYRESRDIRAVQELLGHASVATTQIYTAIDDRDRRSAALATAI